MNLIGIKQGRLSPRPYPALQAFPWGTWDLEFGLAKKIGYDYLEWMFDAENYSENPLWTKDGRKSIKRLIKETGTPVRSICADFFLSRPFYRENTYSIEENIEVLKKLVICAREIGANLILLPVLENSAILKESEAQRLISVLKESQQVLENNNVRIGIETELPINECLDLCRKINSSMVGVYYDTGNYAACGHDLATDLADLGSYVYGVHVKDRLLGGRSVFLGTGDTDFQKVFHALVSMDYAGNLTLEAYYEDDPSGTASHNLQFVKRFLETKKN